MFPQPLLLTVNATNAAAGQKSAPSPVRVYCFVEATSDGFVDRQRTARADSLQDVKESIGARKNWLQLVESADQADVTLQVTGRDSTPTRRTDPVNKQPLTVYRLSAVLRVGDYKTELEGTVENAITMGVWRATARDLAAGVERWARDNYDRAIARRTAAPARESKSPRQVTIDWLLAPTIAAAYEHLLPLTAQQSTAVKKAFESNPDAAPILSLVDLILAPGPQLRSKGATLTTAGQPITTITIADTMKSVFTIGQESVLGDKASVSIRLEWMDQPPVDKKVELIRQADRWFICATDFGPGMSYSYLDQPNPITALLDRIVKGMGGQ